MSLLIATHNPGKVREIIVLLQRQGINCLTLADLGLTHDVDETGDTFQANASLKAVAYAQLSGLRTLADDSGLEVDALGGAPGVHTKRFGSPDLTQLERNALLLDKLATIPAGQRAARFRCVAALAAPDGRLLALTEGSCPGQIALAPAGDGGFGYDPIFYLPEHGCTMAQLDPAQKEAISHRGQALRFMVELLARQHPASSWSAGILPAARD